MAMKEVKSRTARPELLTQQETVRGVADDLQRLIAHVQANPLLYLAGLVFVAVCVAAGLIYGLRQEALERQANTAYTAALEEEDPALRAAALQQVSDLDGDRDVERLYMQAEAKIAAGEYKSAMQELEVIIRDHYESPFGPRAIYASAFAAEADGNSDGALAAYDRLLQDFPDTFWALRAHYRLGQFHEREGRFAEAKAAYEEQMQVFPESTAAARAEQALASLKQKHPELFPAAEDATVEAATPEAAGPADDTSATEIMEDSTLPLPTIDPQMSPAGDGTATPAAPPSENEGTITIPQQVPNLGELIEQGEAEEVAPVVTEEAAPVDTAPVVTEEAAPVDTAPVVTEEVAPVDTAPVETEEAAPVDTAPANP